MDWIATGEGSSSTSGGGSGGSSSPNKKQKKKGPKGNGGGGGDGKGSYPPAYKAALAQICRVSRDVETLKSVAYVSIEAPAAHGIPKGGLEAGKNYNLMTQNNKKHDKGKPHCHVFGALCRETMKDCQVGTPVKAVMENFVNGITSPQMLEPLVQQCQVRKMYDESKVKISWNVTEKTKEVSEIMIAALKNAGATQHYGAAPKNPNERKMARVLGSKKFEEEDSDED